MTSPLDRIRVSTGVDSMPAVSTTQSVNLGRVGIVDVLAARDGATTDIRELRGPSVVAGILAVLSMLLFGPISSWSIAKANVEDLFVFNWIAAVVTVADVHTWGPWVAGAGLAAIIAAAIWTNGVSDAEAPSIVMLTVGGLAAVMCAAPLVIALIIGIVALVIYVVLMILVAAALVAVVGVLLMGSGS